ncbi:MAG: hypothetical protein HY880_06710 [Deltaproteobacteria bacterium]|nr:hypothetical protein [Deltaproteobacteria bacterium]
MMFGSRLVSFAVFLVIAFSCVYASASAAAVEQTTQQFSLIVSTAGSGKGDVSVGETDCNSGCILYFDQDTAVVLTAVAGPGSSFTGWSEDCSGTSTCSLTMNSNKRATAVFTDGPAAPLQYTLTLTKSGEGTGTVKGAPRGVDGFINCGKVCSAAYLLKNTGRPVKVTLRATPSSDSIFAGWEGACSEYGTKRSCIVGMDGDKSVDAKFDPVPRYTLTVNKDGTGTITGVPGGFDKTIKCGPDCSAVFLLKDPKKPVKVTLRAKPAPGFIFSGWSGECSGTAPCAVTMNEDKTVNAVFIPKTAAQVRIGSLSSASAMPASLLTVNGTGFDPRTELSLSFSDGAYSVTVPAVDVRASSVTAPVPPFIDMSTGLYKQGSVSVYVVRKSRTSTVVSEPVGGFQISDLPTPLVSPGTITLGLLKANAEVARLLLDDIKGTTLDTAAMTGALSSRADYFDALAAKVQALMQDPAKTFSIGSVKGADIVVTVPDLASTDRMIIGMMLALGAGSPAAPLYHAGSPAAPLYHEGGPLSLRAAGLDEGGCAATEAKAFAQKALEANPDLTTLGPLVQEVIYAPGQKATCNSAHAFDEAYKIVGGVGGIGIGLLALAGAPAAALALPSAALLYMTIEGAGGMIGVGGILGQTAQGAADMVQNGIDMFEDLLRDTVLKGPLAESTGALYDVAAGSYSLRQAIISSPPHGKGKSYKLSVSKSGTGTGGVSVSPAMEVYAPGSVVTVTAVAGEGSEFKGWSGACSGVGSCVITMNADKSVVAAFKPASAGNSDNISGTWSGGWAVSSPIECQGTAGSWTAVFVDKDGVLSGSWQSSDGSSGSLSGTHHGNTVAWSVGGGGAGVSFSGAISGSGVSGGFSSSQKCLDKGTVSGGFSGAKG